MMSSQSVVSIYYDVEQDRLKFLLTLSNQAQVEGIMTRRLLKSMLNQLPAWLAKQNTVKTSMQQEGVLTSTQQHAINQFQHQAAQPQVQNQQVVTLNKKVERFFVETVNLSSISKQDSRLGIAVKFISADQQDNINLTFSLNQFHQFISVVLEKASDWDLSNPWLIGKFNGSIVMH